MHWMRTNEPLSWILQMSTSRPDCNCFATVKPTDYLRKPMLLFHRMYTPTLTRLLEPLALPDPSGAIPRLPQALVAFQEDHPQTDGKQIVWQISTHHHNPQIRMTTEIRIPDNAHLLHQQWPHKGSQVLDKSKCGLTKILLVTASHIVVLLLRVISMLLRDLTLVHRHFLNHLPSSHRNPNHSA